MSEIRPATSRPVHRTRGVISVWTCLPSTTAAVTALTAASCSRSRCRVGPTSPDPDVTVSQRTSSHALTASTAWSSSSCGIVFDIVVSLSACVVVVAADAGRAERGVHRRALAAVDAGGVAGVESELTLRGCLGFGGGLVGDLAVLEALDAPGPRSEEPQR